jgi:hypothetical protein
LAVDLDHSTGCNALLMGDWLRVAHVAPSDPPAALVGPPQVTFRINEAPSAPSVPANVGTEFTTVRPSSNLPDDEVTRAAHAAVKDPRSVLPPPVDLTQPPAYGGGILGGGTVKIAPSGQFGVHDGKLFDPSGAEFVAKGINAFADQVDPTTILQTFPGINAVRYAITPRTNAGTIDNFVQGLTSKGVVVAIEDHSSAGAAFAPGGSNVLTGGALDSEVAWYKGLAEKYRDNPYVWFGTANEPDAPGNQDSIAQQEIAIYNGIRSTGNKSVIMLEQRGGFTSDFARPYAGDYAKMTNVVSDTHYYGWVPNFSTDPTIQFKALTDQIANAQSIKSADGTMPVIVGEYGPSTTGSGMDPNGTQTVDLVANAAKTSGVGSMAWAWNAGTDALTSGVRTLTDFGRRIAAAFAK